MSVGQFLGLMGYSGAASGEQGLNIKYTKGTATTNKVAQVLNDGTLADLPLKDMASNLTAMDGAIIDSSINVYQQLISITHVDKTRFILSWVDTTNKYLYVKLIRDNLNGTFSSSIAYNAISTSMTIAGGFQGCMVDHEKYFLVYATGGTTTLLFHYFKVPADSNNLSLTLVSNGTLVTMSNTTRYTQVKPLGEGKVLAACIQGTGVAGVIATVADSTVTAGTVYTSGGGMDPAYFTLRRDVGTRFTYMYGGYDGSISRGYLVYGGLTVNTTNNSINWTSLKNLDVGSNRPISLDYTYISPDVGLLACFSGSGGNAYKVTWASNVPTVTSPGLTLPNMESGAFVTAYGNQRAICGKLGTRTGVYNLSVDSTVSLTTSTFKDVISEATYQYYSYSYAQPYLFDPGQKKFSVLYFPASDSDTPKYRVITGQYGKVAGVCQGANNVLLQGVAKGFSNLFAGEAYYYDVNGAISTDPNGVKIGVAVSDSEIFVDQMLLK